LPGGQAGLGKRARAPTSGRVGAHRHRDGPAARRLPDDARPGAPQNPAAAGQRGHGAHRGAQHPGAPGGGHAAEGRREHARGPSWSQVNSGS